jgi:hypothetical protein
MTDTPIISPPHQIVYLKNSRQQQFGIGRVNVLCSLSLMLQRQASALSPVSAINSLKVPNTRIAQLGDNIYYPVWLKDYLIERIKIVMIELQ